MIIDLQLGSLWRRRALLCLLLACCSWPAANSQTGYIYIQGDKQTPFYVKLEGEMQPRYGKNYSILSDLEPGPAHLEILFQQNAFPAQRFTVNVPEGGSRGFLITKQQDAFKLYDLQQGFYLSSGNSETDDRMPPTRSVAVAETSPPQNEYKAETAKERIRRVLKVNTKPVAAPIQKVAKDTPEGEQFIAGITLGNEHAATQSTDNAYADNASTATSVAGIRNSDCPAPLSKEDFSPIYKAALAGSDDEARTAYVLGQMDKCYASWQARALTSMLSTDAARFTILKKIYPRISDQASFPLLDDLLRGPEYKTAFNQLLHPKQ